MLASDGGHVAEGAGGVERAVALDEESQFRDFRFIFVSYPTPSKEHRTHQLHRLTGTTHILRHWTLSVL